MNEGIMRWSSDAMYGGKLIAHQSVKDRVVDDIASQKNGGSELLGQPLLIIDTAGSLMHEGMETKQPKLGGVSESKFNEGEADLVVIMVKELINDLGLKVADIGVISPYNAQVNLIKKLLRESFPEQTLPEISTVDGF